MDGDRPVAILPNHFFAPYPGADTRFLPGKRYFDGFRIFRMPGHGSRADPERPPQD